MEIKDKTIDGGNAFDRGKRAIDRYGVVSYGTREHLLIVKRGCYVEQ